MIKKRLETKNYKPEKTTEFKINERGKVRNIKANSINDRVVNNLLVNEVLTPLTEPLLIYDNGASRKGFGISHSRSRLEKHLHDAMLNFGTDSVILVFDLSKYFDSIYVPKLLYEYKKLIDDNDIFNLLVKLVAAHNEFDLDELKQAIANSNAYNPSLCGMGIGSVISQNAGIFYPTPFDNWITKCCSNKYYGRYMDDFYLICKDLNEARKFRDLVPKYLKDKLFLTVNPKKTQTARLTHGFKYLKFFYKVSRSGKIYKRQDNDSFRRERAKIKKFKNTKMTENDVLQSYKAWRGNVSCLKYNSQRLKRTDEVFSKHYPYLFKKLKSELSRS